MKTLSLSVISFLTTYLCIAQTVSNLNDLSAFRDPGKTWKMAGSVTADLQEKDILNTSAGKTIIVNLPDKKNKGIDLLTKDEYGDVDLELDFMMASGSNSGIYLQGRYEIQLHDTWGSRRSTSGTNGGIYERWDESLPEGKKGYGGFPPRMNASRAPGLWQHLKVSFQSPRFDASGKKIENARMRSIELNGVLIHEDVELFGPTRGTMGEEKARGPLRIQGDHGAVALRNIKVTSIDKPRSQESETVRPYRVYPINVDPLTSPVFRSFMDLPDGTRVIHAASVGSPEKIHYTYDMDTGMIIQVWRGDFLDATPMWFSRGDGSSRPTGAVLRFGTPLPVISKLSSPQSPWKKDTVSSGFRSKGYVLNENDRPVFVYGTHGISVKDAVHVLANGQGIGREITIDIPDSQTYVRLAEGAAIHEIAKGTYLIDHNAYYLRLDDYAGVKPIIRSSEAGQELIIPAQPSLKYSILF